MSPVFKASCQHHGRLYPITVLMGLGEEFMMLVTRVFHVSTAPVPSLARSITVGQLLGTRCDPYGMNLCLTTVLVGAKVG